MKLDEAITVSSIERFTAARKMAMGASFLSGAALASSGMPFLVTVGGSLAFGYLASFLDKYLNGKNLKKQLYRLNDLNQKRETIINCYKTVAKKDPNYFAAVNRILTLIKHDVNSIASTILQASVKTKTVHSEKAEELDALIKIMQTILDANKRPLTESYMTEALEIIPASIVGVVYLRDKITRYGYMRLIKAKYKPESVGDPKAFDAVEPLIWKYMKETAAQYYRNMVTDEEFIQQSQLVMQIVKDKDLTILFK